MIERDGKIVSRSPDIEEEVLVISTGPVSKLVVSIVVYDARATASIRSWLLRGGNWMPAKSGCRIRLRELTGVIGALTTCRELLLEREAGQAEGKPR